MKNYSICEPVENFLNNLGIDYKTDYEKNSSEEEHWLIIDNSIVTKELELQIVNFIDSLEDGEKWDINTTSDGTQFLIIHSDYIFENFELITAYSEFKKVLESKTPESNKKESFILVQGDEIVDSFTDKTKALEAFNKYPKIAERPSLTVSMWKLIKQTKLNN